MRSWNRLVATTRSTTSFAPSLSLALRCCTGRPTTPTSAATSTATTGSSSSSTTSSTSSESSFVSAAAMQQNSTTARRDGTTSSPNSSSSSSSREEVLAVWNNNSAAAGSSSSSNGSGSTAADAAAKEPLRGGAGMNFASALGRKLMSPLTKREVTTQAGTSLSQVSWSQYERLDFLMNFRAPSSWRVHEVTRENYLVVQITPPPRVTPPPPPSAAPSPSFSSTSAPTKNAFLLHGLNISCFAYHRKVPPEVQSETLMRDFLKRFGHCVEDSVKIVDLASQQATTMSTAEGAPNVSKGGSPSSSTLASKLASQLGGSVAEIEFTVKDPDSEARVRARALSRAFYATNRRFHYIVTMAVPEVEFAHSLDLVTHTVMGVTECRAEVATKNF